jgi:hypothetical protein
MRSTGRLTNAVRARKKAVSYIGAAAALVGAGTAGAASFAGVAHAQPAAVVHHVPAHHRTVTPRRAAPKGAPEALSSGRHATNTTQAAPMKSAALAPKVAAAKTPASASKAAPAKGAAPAKSAPAPAPQPSWSQIQQQVDKQTSPSEPQAANQLQPVPAAGTQAWMPVSPAQQANATTIVQQALHKGMGVRSAVIAVATAMQESQLQNINYGDRDSLGLFQQRPSMGWGTAQQITTPSYAADAFLGALQQQQASNPGWAQQPLWTSAQAVQKSGFPLAYAKWETQAVQLVKNIVTQVK